MVKALDNMDSFQSELLYMIVTCLSIKEIETQLVDNILIPIIVILKEHHTNGGIRNS